jgi:hypothetical protein
MNLSQEVATLETEVVSLRADVEMRKQHQAILEWENTSLRAALAKLQAERDHALQGRDEVKVLLDQTGAALVSGIQKFHATQRTLQQDRQLGEDDEPPPKFISDASKALASTVN